MALPQGIQRLNFLSASAPTDGIIHSIAQKGGYQEIYHENDLPSITCFENGNSAYTGFTLSDDLWSSGRRRVGMMVFITKTRQFFNLIPVGFAGNQGDLLEADWINMPEWERALRIDPAGTYCSEGATPANGFTAVQKTAADIGISADPMGCWIETGIGADGQDGTSGVDGQAGTSGVDGQAGTPGVDGQAGTSGVDGQAGTSGVDGQAGTSGVDGALNLLDFWSEGAEFYKVGQDSEYENVVNNRNPNLYVCKGETYTFRRSTGGHPLNIFSQNGNIAAGIVSGSLPVIENADLVWKVPQDAFGTYTYVCTAHASMTGTITVCCADGTPAPDPTATPVPQPDPTATPVPDPTATAIPDPTATAIPDPTATPQPDEPVYTFGVNVNDGLGDVEKEEACEDLKHPIYTSDKSDPMQLNIGDELWQDIETSVPFDGSDRWYDVGDNGTPKLKVKIRGGAVVAVADCPGDSPEPTPQPDPTATPVPQPDPTATPVPQPDPTATPDAEAKYTTTWNFEEASQDPNYKIVSGTGSSRNEEDDLTLFRTPAASKETFTNHFLWIVRRDGKAITDTSEARLELQGVAQQHLVNQSAIRVQIPHTQLEGDRTYTGTLTTSPE